MRGRTRAFAAIAAMMMLAPVLARAELPLTARSAVVVDARTGAVLYDHNGDVPLPPASTTKVMTAVLALESGRLDDELTVSDYAAYTAPTRMGLRPGERVQLRNLVYAMLLKSANDASVVVAEGLAGSESRFAARMTAKAHLLGATTAHFENPNGLPVDGHVASARDLAVIFRYGLRYPQFREIPRHAIHRGAGRGRWGTLRRPAYAQSPAHGVLDAGHRQDRLHPCRAPLLRRGRDGGRTRGGHRVAGGVRHVG